MAGLVAALELPPHGAPSLAEPLTAIPSPQRLNLRPVLDVDPACDVLEISRPAKLTRQQLTHPSIALGEDLEHVPVGSTHCVADVCDESTGISSWNKSLVELMNL